MCDLAGEWVPTRHDEWYNNNPGKHRLRARVPYTKVTYDTAGKGNGWVGELNINIEVFSIAPGKYTASCRVGLWYAGDGNLTILDDGVLQVRYPSNGIVEYWQRVDGQGAINLAKAQSKWKAAEKVRGKASERSLTLALRACVEVANEEYVWHWALAVNDEVYEVAAWMAIMGPRGIVASNSLVAPYNTALGQFHGYLLWIQRRSNPMLKYVNSLRIGSTRTQCTTQLVPIARHLLRIYILSVLVATCPLQSLQTL